MKIIEKIFNVETGEETIIERDETSQEEASRLQRIAELQIIKSEAEAKEAQRQAILDRLGITSEEAKILLGA
jgi:hypothetical protein